MRIVGHALYRYRRPFVRPLRFGPQRLTERVGFLLRLLDEDGREGWGEAAPLPGFGMEPAGGVPGTLRGAVRRLGAELPTDALGLSAALPELPPASRAALETALADLASQRAGLPLCNWLNARAAIRVGVNGLLGAASEQSVGQLRRGLSAGVRCFKIKAGVSAWSAERAVLHALRDASPTARLRVDVNGGWTEAQLRARMPELHALGLEYLEQPLPAAQTERLIALAPEVGLPLAVDEALLAPASRERLLACAQPLVFVIKPAALGGPLRAWRLIRCATERGMRVVVTHLLDGPIGRGMALQLALAAAADHGLAHGLGLPPFAPGHDDGPRPVGGSLTRPPVAGLGGRPALGRLQRLG